MHAASRTNRPWAVWPAMGEGRGGGGGQVGGGGGGVMDTMQLPADLKLE